MTNLLLAATNSLTLLDYVVVLTYLVVITLVIVLIWPLGWPAIRTSPEGGPKRWDENLKFGASVALGLQILIYLWL